jgi:hypothetical protein
MGVGDDLPHDLAQYVIEAATGFESGFWGLLATGATFASTGRKRTRPGRAIIADHRAELLASEQLAQRHLTEWKQGIVSPVTRALDRAFAHWSALGPDDRFRFVWPSPDGVIATDDVLVANDPRARSAPPKDGQRAGDAYTGRNATRS